MAKWSDKLDAFLKQNEEDLLTHAGTVKNGWKRDGSIIKALRANHVND